MILACQKLLGQITKVLGLRRPLPPYVGKNSQIIPYFFSDAFPNLLMQLSFSSLPIFNAHTLTEHFSGKLIKFEVSSKNYKDISKEAIREKRPQKNKDETERL